MLLYVIPSEGMACPPRQKESLTVTGMVDKTSSGAVLVEAVAKVRRDLIVGRPSRRSTCLAGFRDRRDVLPHVLEQIHH